MILLPSVEASGVHANCMRWSGYPRAFGLHFTLVLPLLLQQAQPLQTVRQHTLLLHGVMQVCFDLRQGQQDAAAAACRTPDSNGEDMGPAASHKEQSVAATARSYSGFTAAAAQASSNVVRCRSDPSNGSST